MEFLSRHGVPFEAHDIRQDPASLADLRASGRRKPPAFLVGDGLVEGFVEDRLRGLLGLG